MIPGARHFALISSFCLSLNGAGLADVVTTLPASPTQTFTTQGLLSNIGDASSNSFNDFAWAAEGIVAGDTLDATFAMTVTLADHTTADRQTLWETGGGTIGLSLNYEAGNVLVMRMSGNDGGGNGSGYIEVVSPPVTAGTYDLIWTVDIDGANPPIIALYIDGVLAGSGTHLGSWTTQDWSGSGGAGIGEQDGSMSGDGSNTNISSEPFTNGSFDLVRGLEFYADTLFVIPETGVTLVGNTLTLSDINGAASTDQLEISYAGGVYTITDTGGLILNASTIAGSAGSGSSSVTIPEGTIDSIQINTAGGDDTVTILSVQATLGGGFTIDCGNDTDAISIDGAVSTGAAGALVLSAESIIQSASLTVGGTTTLDATGGLIALNDVTNDFVGPVSATGTTLTLNDANTITLDQVSSAGTLSVWAGTLITDITGTPGSLISVALTTVMETPGNIAVNKPSTHDYVGGVTLRAARVQNFEVGFGGLIVDEITTTQTNINNTLEIKAGGVDFAGDVMLPTGGNLTVRVGNSTTQSGGSIVANVLNIRRINGAGNVTLNNTGNDVNEFRVTEQTNSAFTDVSFIDIDDVQLGEIWAYGDLYIEAGGDVTNSNTLTIEGTTTIESPGSVSLTHAGNELDGAIHVNGTDVSVNNLSKTILGDIVASSSLTVTCVDTINQEPGTLINTPDASFTALDGANQYDVTLTQAGNLFGPAGLDAAGGNIEIVAAGDLVLGDIDATGSLTVTATGSISDNGNGAGAGDDINVAGAAHYMASGSIVLNDSQNGFGGPVSASGSPVTINNAGPLTLGDVDAGSSLTVTAGGPITQSAGSSIIAGTGTLHAEATGTFYDIVLDQTGNTFGSDTVHATGANIVITEADDVILGDIDATLGLTVTSVAGSISDNGDGVVSGEDINVLGPSSFTAATAVTLDDIFNDFTGPVSAAGTSVTLRDANSIDLEQITPSGNLSVQASGGDITDSVTSLIDVGGTASFTASDTIFLDRPDHHTVDGEISLSAFRIQRFHGREGLTFSSITATDTSNFGHQIRSFSGVLTLNGNVSVAGDGDLILRIQGDAVQTAGTITADRLRFVTVGTNKTVTFLGNNDINALEHTEGGGNIPLASLNFNDVDDLAVGLFDRTRHADITAAGDIIVVGSMNIEANLGDFTFNSGATITVAAMVNTHGGTLVLEADDDIVVNADITGGGGNLTLNSDADSDNSGGVLIPTGILVDSGGGNIVIGGGNDPSNTSAYGTAATSNRGILIQGATVSSGAGSILLRGNGINDAIGIDGGTVTSTSGDITIFANGAGSVAGVSGALSIGGNGSVSTTSGAITITANGAGNADGVILSSATGGSILSGGAGTIQIQGVSASQNGLRSGNPLNVIGGPLASGDITIATDSYEFTAGSVQSTGNLAIRPFTNGTSVGVGGATGILELSDSELALLADGFASVTIGGATAGTVNLDTVTFTDPVIISGEFIRDNAGTDIDAGTDTVSLDGTVAPGQSPGILMVSGDLELASGSTYEAELGSGAPGSEYDQIAVVGSVSIGTGVTLTAVPFGLFEPAPGSIFTIIDNDGADPVSGTFDGLPESALVTVGTFTLQISYTGGDGNDVTLSIPISSEVTTTADSGTGSLRDALAVTGSGGTITFAAGLTGDTISLTSGPLVIDKSITIDASALLLPVTLDAGGASRVLTIDDGSSGTIQTVILNHLKITGGSATGIADAGNGGGIFNDEGLSLISTTVEGNSSTSSGGGLYSTSSQLFIVNSAFRGNSSGGGGGIYNESAPALLVNCCLSGNQAVQGGGMFNAFASPLIVNATITGNNATSEGGGIFDFDSSPNLSNTLIWNNAEGTSNSSAGASVSQNGTSTAGYSYCLVENIDLSSTGTGNFDGGDASNDPLFVLELDPFTAPGTGGDFRLQTGSPALEAGLNTANEEPLDILGNPRIQDTTIDLGAYEGNVDATFALLFPTLDPNDDDNGNGVSNYGDYAAGGNPTGPDDPSLRPKLVGDQLTFSFRNNAVDVAVEFQKSTTLLAGSWMPMVEGVDYAIDPTETIEGVRTLLTLEIATPGDRLFFREEFTDPGE
ncbi:bacteriocin [Haloferula helveola]|uniref:Bacteriocin n=1 Tax=Haloferula helveola TaxID=490095 RepID=A0ABM7RG24_9BACT|nr:bacteriocin [Haloferula helveola]